MKVNLRIPFVRGLMLLAQTIDWAQEPERIIRTGHPGEFIEVAFSPDGRILAGAGPRWSKLWDVRTGKELRSLASGGHILFNGNGKVLAVSILGKTTTWDVRTGKVVHMLDGYVGPFNPDGKILATASEKEIKALNQNWNHKTRPPTIPTANNHHPVTLPIRWPRLEASSCR